MHAVIVFARIALVAVMWLVSLCRLPSARHQRWKGALWAAFLALAIAMTFDIPQAASQVNDATGVPALATLIKHLTGLIACAAVLEWVIALTRLDTDTAARRRLRYSLAAAAALAMTVLFSAIAHRSNGDFADTMADNGTAVAYLAVFETYLGIAMACASVLFLTAARRTPPELLRQALWTLGTGTCLGVAYAVLRSVFLIARLNDWNVPGGTAELHTLTEVLQALAILLILVGSSLPAATFTAGAVRDYQALNELRPLWEGLTVLHPELVLGSPPTRRSDRITMTGVRGRLIRRVTEIRDASLLLRGYVAVPDIQWANDHLAENGLSGSRLYAASAAVAVHVALDAKAAGHRPGAYEPTTPYGGADLTAEVQWLRMVAQAFGTPQVTDLAHELNQRAAVEHP
jgi:ABC-type Co2+ transport system permease subunit